MHETLRLGKFVGADLKYDNKKHQNKAILVPSLNSFAFVQNFPFEKFKTADFEYGNSVFKF